MAVFDFVVHGSAGDPHQPGVIFQYGDGSVRPIGNIESAVFEIRREHPGGANYILIGLAANQGMKIVKTGPGTLTVLIGLLIPGIDKITDGTSNTLTFLETALRPGGAVGFVMADGSVRNARGPSND